MGLLKNITNQQNIYTQENNFENGKNPQAHNEKSKKCPAINWHPERLIYLGNVHVIYLENDRLDLAIIFYKII